MEKIMDYPQTEKLLGKDALVMRYGATTVNAFTLTIALKKKGIYEEFHEEFIDSARDENNTKIYFVFSVEPRLKELLSEKAASAFASRLLKKK